MILESPAPDNVAVADRACRENQELVRLHPHQQELVDHEAHQHGVAVAITNQLRSEVGEFDRNQSGITARN